MKRPPIFPSLLLLRTFAAASALMVAAANHPLKAADKEATLAAAKLSPYAREVFDAAMKVSDAQWDDRAALLSSTTVTDASGLATHNTRATAYYIIGLLARDGAGD